MDIFRTEVGGSIPFQSFGGCLKTNNFAENNPPIICDEAGGATELVHRFVTFPNGWFPKGSPEWMNFAERENKSRGEGANSLIKNLCYKISSILRLYLTVKQCQKRGMG